MRLDHPSYVKLVIATYHEKRLSNQLQPLLAQPTPAGIRKECATVYQERYDKKDEPMLRAFFGPAEQGRRFQALIEGFDVNKFRPLDTFLKEEGKKEIIDQIQEERRRGITDRNLELLAWLIDFKYRPFVFGMEVLLTNNERQILGIEDAIDASESGELESNSKRAFNNEEEFETTVETEIDDVKNAPKDRDDKTPVILVIDSNEVAAKDRNNSLQNPIWKKPAAIGLISAVLLGTVYFGSRNSGNTDTGCMYWTGDHYKKVSCDTVIKDGLKLSFDKSLENLRMITQVDTITERSIGKVHYIKRNGAVEFYTAGGNHPVEPSRSLKPLSAYMYKTYLQKESIPNKDSVSGEALNHINNR